MRHELLHLDPDEILPPRYNSRKEEDLDSEAEEPDGAPSFSQLCRSIQELGLLQPIVVMRLRAGHELVAGSRRLRAWKLVCPNKKIPCVIVPTSRNYQALTANVGQHQAESAEALARNLSENLQRKGIEPWEKAQALYELQALGLSVLEISKLSGLSAPLCSRLILIRKRLLPELWEHHKRWGHGVLGHHETYSISQLPPEEQIDAWNKMVEKKRNRPPRGVERRPKLKLDRYLSSVKLIDFAELKSKEWRAGCAYALEVALGHRRWEYGTTDRVRKQVIAEKQRRRRVRKESI